jgi:hypothetical protein
VKLDLVHEIKKKIDQVILRVQYNVDVTTALHDEISDMADFSRRIKLYRHSHFELSVPCEFKKNLNFQANSIFIFSFKIYSNHLN